jgi:glycosyltransferase involved in cell wall biosynthesis
MGVRIRSAATVNRKGLDAFAHTAAGSLIALKEKFDIVHYHGIGPSLFSFLPGLRRIKTVATVYALDWQRAKWGRGAQVVLKAGEWAAAHLPDRTIVVSRELQEYLQARYQRQATFIPNGVTFVSKPRSTSQLKPLGLKKGGYILFLGRLVREKGCHDLIRAYLGLELNQEMPLVVAGGSSHSDDYVERLKEVATGRKRVIYRQR